MEEQVPEQEQVEEIQEETPEPVTEETEPEPEGEKTDSEELEAPAAEEPPAEKPVSRRESLRIQQLISKMKQDSPQAQQPMNYQEALEADPETVKSLEADREAYASSKSTEISNSLLFQTRLEIDAPKVESKYKFLDQNSQEFNPAAANAINDWYLQSVGYNRQTGQVRTSDIRYADFVDSIMELADNIAGQKVAESSKNITKQAATTGLRPDGSSAKLDLNKAPQDMSDAELNAVISQVIPKK